MLEQSYGSDLQKILAQFAKHDNNTSDATEQSAGGTLPRLLFKQVIGYEDHKNRRNGSGKRKHTHEHVG